MPGAPDRSDLLTTASANAGRLGLPGPTGAHRPIIASGHQPWLWHPGILAKEIAMRAGADRLGAQTLHLIVDQDVHAALELELPHVDGQRLSTRLVHLGDERLTVPTGFQPPADARQIIHRLKVTKADAPASVGAGLDRLIEAFSDLPDCRTLAEQMAVALHRLKRPWAGDVPVIFASDLAATDVFSQLVDAMLSDARSCVHVYNRAVDTHPQTGMSRLIEHRELVELPLWAAAWQQPRQRVFADVVDTKPLLVLQDGTPINHDRLTLLPRALFMTALLRSRFTDIFIHGKGGGLYDAVTEAWWRDWQGQALLPRATVSADVWLSFDVPVADRHELAKARWYRHWLPHNVDRVAEVNAKQAAEKRTLIEQMDDDRDKHRRRAAFERIHRINADLLASHLQTLDEAEARLTRAAVGVGNATIARKRDWCFALYPPQQLDELAKRLSES